MRLLPVASALVLAFPAAGWAERVVVDFEDLPASGYLWMPPAAPYHDIVSMGPNFMAYEQGFEPWVRSMGTGRWSVVNWGGGLNTRSIEFAQEVHFHGARFTWGQEWYGGSWVAAEWLQIVGKDRDGAVVGTTAPLTLDQTWQYLDADFFGVKTIELTSVNQHYSTSYYQLDDLEYSTIVPEPASLALLAGGGFTLVKRRRR